jgi:hypothetical protein
VEVQAMVRVLDASGRAVDIARHRPRRGMAEQRHALLARAAAPFVLFVDDDVWLEPATLGRMAAVLADEGCVFVGCFPTGLSFVDDRRPEVEALFEEWAGPVVPESDEEITGARRVCASTAPPTRRTCTSASGHAGTRRGHTVAVTGGADERGLTRRLVAGICGDACDLGGQLSLGGLTGLLARATLLVSNDTGPRHLAAAVGTATMGLYWVGNMINAGPITRRLHRTAVSWRTHCPVCGVDCATGALPGRTAGARCPHNPSFLDGISVEDVWANLEDLLSALSTPHGRSPPRPRWPDSKACVTVDRAVRASRSASVSPPMAVGAPRDGRRLTAPALAPRGRRSRALPRCARPPAAGRTPSRPGPPC